MRVLILHTDFRVYWKGRLTYLKKFLTEQGVDFYAIELFGKGSPYSFDQYNNSEQWWTCLFPDKSIAELNVNELKDTLFAKLDQINPDVIIGGSIVFFSGALGIRWAKHHKKKFVMFDDAKPSYVKRNALVTWVKDTITKQIDGLWLPSKDYDNEYSNLDKKRVLFFHGYSCIDNQLFKPIDNSHSKKREIICVARFVPVKNIDNLLRAWKIVEDTNTGYKLIIIGNGPEHDNLTRIVADFDLRHVDFPGIINNEDIPAYFNNADAFILPSLYESWGLVVNEAMAAGLPVLLSSKINACNTLLKEDVNGFSFDPYDVGEISEKIIKYIVLPTKSKQDMATNSLKVINTMSYENMGTELMTALKYISGKKYRSTGIIARVIINLWPGKYDTSAWDKL